jgi:hypothetical protein
MRGLRALPRKCVTRGLKDFSSEWGKICLSFRSDVEYILLIKLQP